MIAVRATVNLNGLKRGEGAYVDETDENIKALLGSRKLVLDDDYATDRKDDDADRS